MNEQLGKIRGGFLPERALHRGPVLVDPQQVAERLRAQLRQQQLHAHAVAREGLVRHELRGDALGFALRRRLAERQRVRLQT